MLRLAGKANRAGSALVTAALAASAFLGMAGPASAADGKQPASLTAGGMHVQNANSNKCLVAQGTANNAGAFQYDCASFADQNWSLVPTAWTNTYQLQNVNSNKCLVVQGGANGSGAFQYDCASFADQYWTLTPTSWSDAYQLRNMNSGKCLVVQGTANGSGAFQYDCASFADQYWTIY
ncbi:RICIN domain-containing protein [Kitasatospora sp. NPDC089797]|uniref:RICIN domain-containing protein n=1 Tax=Kitasatospora sp. NPDC089797 TaxID=3155298 RepID=UPI00342833B3